MQECDGRIANEHAEQALGLQMGGQKFLASQVGGYSSHGPKQIYSPLRRFGLGAVHVLYLDSVFPLPNSKLRFGLHDFFRVQGFHQCSDLQRGRLLYGQRYVGC